jgi:DNA-directed RNA polymerase subunit RPC12/RpoP
MRHGGTAMTITEKVAFLKGLIDGSELKLDTKEGKIFELIIEILDDMANTMAEIDEDVTVLYDEVEDISEVLEDIDETVYHMTDGHDGRGRDDEDFMYEIQCEKCGEKLCIDEDTLLGDDISCPACGERIEFEFNCGCEECEEGEKGGGHEE